MKTKKSGLSAVILRSNERFVSFQKMLEEYGIQYINLDFDSQDWMAFDYSQVEILIYYPSFLYSSNHPLALYQVKDNLMHIASMYPTLKMYPDPKIIDFYNDKYKQYLFLSKHNYPIPTTYPLFSEESLKLAEENLGYPMIIKNRFGTGGDSVFKVNNRKELTKYYYLSTFNFFNLGSVKYLLSFISRRIFFYHLIRAKKMIYPFLSPPLLAQRYITMDRDLKTVVGNYKVVEAHWRIQANKDQWKVNIDGGGIGEWSKIPQEAINLSEKLARDLKTSWLNIDIIPSQGEYLITEFSPVWHHYAYKEKASFVYKDDYNIDVPLEISLCLERIIVDSLIQAVKNNK